MIVTRPILHLIASALLLLGLLIPLAKADEALFGYIYTTDSIPAGHWEYEQIHTVRHGKARGVYGAVDLRNEIEYGVTDRFSAAVYLNSSFLRTAHAYDAEDPSIDLADRSDFGINGVSFEFKYRLLSPYLDPVGLSLYAEPEMGIRDAKTGENVIERAIEFRVILQKNFLDDTLVVASNLMLEPEWERAGEENLRELFAELTLGASYRFLPKWWVGVELRNHREFPDMDFGKQEHSAFFLGPSVHYGVEKWWATVTVLPQVYGHPRALGTGSDGQEISDSFRHLAQHEKLEARLKIGINF
jgi:hypothetical protein